jgi:hypothetical protein
MLVPLMLHQQQHRVMLPSEINSKYKTLPGSRA